MQTSTEISALAAALAKAQRSSDRFSEAPLLREITGITHPLAEGRGGHQLKRGRIVRFIERIAFGMTDCWFWRGRLDSDGYGTFGAKRAHRVSFQMFKGEVPSNLVVMHSCDVRSCVNPEHLSIGTHQDNIRDRDTKGRTYRSKKNV